MQNTILDREWRYSYLYKITNKESKLITFSPNSVQKFVRAHELHLRKEYGVVRLVILKGRQLGMTTYNLIKALDRVLFYRNQTVVIIPHLAKDEQDFFDNIQALYKNIPERIADERYPGGVWVKPKPKYSTRKEMIFEGMNSTIQIKSQTRGKTVSHLHITELAFNENASKMMTGALPSMPENADIIIESTANGIGNYYYNLWNSNVDNPDPEFHCLFVPWYLEDRYRSDRHRDIPGELKTLKRIFADGTIDQEQVNWYVKMYNSLEGMDVLQEYPSTPEEAFLATGDMFFDKDIVM